MQVFLCNKCFKRFTYLYTEAEPFYLKTCTHFFCQSCVLPECPICKRTNKSYTVSKDMPTPLAEYFEDPKKILKRYQHTVKFQCEQQARANRYYVEDLSGKIKKEKKIQSGLTRVEQQIDTLLTIEKKRIAKLKKYLAYYERRLEQPTFLGSESSNNNRLRIMRKSCQNSEASTSIHTPTLSLPDTPNERTNR